MTMITMCNGFETKVDRIDELQPVLPLLLQQAQRLALQTAEMGARAEGFRPPNGC